MTVHGQAVAVAVAVATCPFGHPTAREMLWPVGQAMHPPQSWPAAIGSRSVKRHCSRSGCSEDAAVTLTFQYSLAQVWLDELAKERDPHAYDLCPRHAGRLSAPQGWQVRDRRQVERTVLIAV